MGTDTLTRIETLSANEALLQSRLGECVNHLKLFARDCDRRGWNIIALEVLDVVARSEAALRTVEARHDSPSAGQVAKEG